MSEDLRRKNDKIMAEVIGDIKVLKKVTDETRKSVDQLTDTMGDFIHQNENEHRYLMRGMFGDEKQGDEGLVKKTQRHENEIEVLKDDNMRYKTTIKVLQGITALSAASTAWELLPILKAFLSVVGAGN